MYYIFREYLLKPLILLAFKSVAEREGFEPSKGYKPLLVFKTSAFNRSATSPVLWKMFLVLHILNKTNCNIFVLTAKLLYFIYRGFFSWSLSLTCFGSRMIEPISVIIFFALSTSCAFVARTPFSK